MIYYQSPRPYLLAHDQDQPLEYERVKGFFVRTWDKSLGAQPSAETVDNWVPPEPEPEPVDPVATIATALAGRELAAAQAITHLKASVALALMQGGLSQEATNAAGSALVVQHSAAIQAYILAGGNSVAGQALLEAIQASPPEWWSEPIAAIFSATLGK